MTDREYNEQQLDLFADLIDQIEEVVNDTEVKSLWAQKKLLKTAAYMVRNHKTATISLLAFAEGVNPDEYRFTAVSLPAKIVKMLSSPDFAVIREVFISLGQNGAEGSSGSATGDIQAGND